MLSLQIRFHHHQRSKLKIIQVIIRLSVGRNHCTDIIPAPEETKLFLAISKIASLASFSGRNTGFAGPLARANLTFGSFANALGGALRDLFESLLLSMLLHHETERETRENWYELSRATPFKTPINVATGLAMNQYLLMLGPKASDEEKAEVKKELGDFFSTAKDLDWDVLRGFETYSAVSTPFSMMCISLISLNTGCPWLGESKGGETDQQSRQTYLC